MGKSRSGKTTAAQCLRQLLGENAEKLEMSGPLKNVCHAMFGIPIWAMDTQDGKELYHTEQKMSVREVMQRMGDMFDNHYRDYFPHKSKNTPIWAHEGVVEELVEAKNPIVITGLRKKDQVEWVLRAGGIVLYMDRTPPAGVTYSGMNHVTETGVEALRGLCHEVIDNNGSEEDLMNRLMEVVVKYSTPLN
ncbi:MAG: hypothetical protein KUG81_09715 [Gammaproteobacteria bacterium]|nr:hypothetical protein [Gammaproteobacteria bacterium]